MIRKAMNRAWELYKQHLGMLLSMTLMETVLVLIALSPMLFLFAKPVRPLALLSIPAFLLILLPMRQNEAQLLADLDAGRQTGIWQLVSGYRYGRKLGRGVKVTLLMLLWGCLFIAATVVIVYYFRAKGVEGSTDALTILRMIQQLGGGSIQTGIFNAVYIYLATLLPILFGFAFHSGTRHAYTTSQGRKVLKGHRLAVIGMSIASLVVLLPFFAVTIYASTSYIAALREVLQQFNISGSITIPKPDRGMLVIGIAFVVLVLPLLPLRKLMTACRVHLMDQSDAA